MATSLWNDLVRRGLAALAPTMPGFQGDTFGFYYRTDSQVLTFWDGDEWIPLGASGPEVNYPEVAAWANLPDPTLNSGAIYLVQTTTGVPLINRKPAGLWRSNGVSWFYLGNGITASDIVNTPAGSIAATDVQSALNELDGDIAGKQPLDTQLTDLALLAYAGNALKTIRVNAGENGFELTTPSGGISDADYGDITVSGSGAVWTIDPGAVTLAKQADMATASVVYRKTAGAGAPEVQTLATLKTDLLLTGTNSGDQTTIVGITGTKAQFDTAVTDGNFLYVGDVTQYTDELAQDAVGAMVDASLTYADATPLLQRAALTGAVTAPAGSNATVLGSFTTAALNTALSDNDVATGGGTATGTNTGDQTTITGNAGTATTLQTSRNFSIAGSGITAATVGFNGSAAVILAASVDAGHITLARMADIATASLIYRKTAGSGVPEVQTLATLKTDLGLTGTNSGDQMITLTSDVTGSGTGSFATTIAADVVTNTKLANMATATFKGRITAATGDPEDLTGTQATTLLDAFTSALKGLAPASGGGSSNFLRADGTWQAPPGTGGINSGLTTVDFGVFPGSVDASVTIPGQATIVASSKVKAYIVATATADHSADEHFIEPIEVKAGDIVASTSFKIYAKAVNSVNEGSRPTIDQTRVAGPAGNIRPDTSIANNDKLYGQFTVAWEWI